MIKERKRLEKITLILEGIFFSRLSKFLSFYRVRLRHCNKSRQRNEDDKV